MKEKISIFQLVLLVILGFAIVIGVLLFSMQRSGTDTEGVPVTMWGILPQDAIQTLIDTVQQTNRKLINVTYVAFTPEEFDGKLVEALASGTGPDLVIFNDDLLLKHENKLSTVAYEFYPQKVFKDTFIDAGNILLKKDGIVGFPLMIDPMVMYYNKTILNSEGIATIPKYWSEFSGLAASLVKKEVNFTITRSAVSLGEFRNVKNAKEIFATLVMQAGNPIVVRNTNQDDSYDRTEFLSIFSERLGFNLVPAEAALTYFTQFSNPSKTSYSWNRSLPSSEDMFLSGDLVFYFGPASEYTTLQRKNPNLNFDVALMPQSLREKEEKIVHGDLYFIGLIKNSPNLEASFNTAYTLTNQENINLLSTITNLPPVRRDLLVNKNENSILQTFYSSALIAQPFIDPSPRDTNTIFTDMVESVVSGRLGESESVLRAASEISKYIK